VTDPSQRPAGGGAPRGRRRHACQCRSPRARSAPPRLATGSRTNGLPDSFRRGRIRPDDVMPRLAYHESACGLGH